MAPQRFAFGRRIEIDGGLDKATGTQSYRLQRGDQGDQCVSEVVRLQAQGREVEEPQMVMPTFIEAQGVAPSELEAAQFLRPPSASAHTPPV
jgi:hypothetical protein